MILLHTWAEKRIKCNPKRQTIHWSRWGRKETLCGLKRDRKLTSDKNDATECLKCNKVREFLVNQGNRIIVHALGEDT